MGRGGVKLGAWAGDFTANWTPFLRQSVNLLLDVSHDHALGQDLHHDIVVLQVAAGQVAAQDGVRERVALVDL